MGKFDGKKLLVLGTSVGSVEIVEYAKSEGAYVIVTDYLPVEKSEAKRYADETALISTLDVEALYEFAKEKKIDGVFCGVSERNLLSVNELANRLNLPCYFNMEQWNLLGNKQQFKNLCKSFNVPIAKEYTLDESFKKEDLSKIKYPVIVKPVDRSAAIGIHICNNERELIDGYKDAISKSFCKKALVEQYLKGLEFSAYYTFIDGECRTSIIFDKHLASDNPKYIPLPEAYVFPSQIQERYLKEFDENVKAMLKSLGLKNGVACIQGAIDGNDVGVFEAGLRMGGTALYRFIEHINGNNFLKMLTNYAITGEMEGDISLEDANLKGKCGCILSLLNKGGTIGKIIGVQEAGKLKGVIKTVVRYSEGQEIIADGTLRQSHIRFFLVCNSKKELQDLIVKIKELVHVKDAEGNEMIYSNFDVKKLEYMH